jgi:peptidoglycan/LPS O-acetylase OafA/YrhL
MDGKRLTLERRRHGAELFPGGTAVLAGPGVRMLAGAADTDVGVRTTKNSAWVTWLAGLAIAVCLFFGFWAFVYQGYTEDSGSRPIQSWPYGAALYGAAGVLIFLMIRRARPDLSGKSLWQIGLVLALMLALAALASLDAGGHSFEF